MKEKHPLAESVVQARATLEQALAGKRRWPRTEFQILFDAVVAYTHATAADEMMRFSGYDPYFDGDEPPGL